MSASRDDRSVFAGSEVSHDAAPPARRMTARQADMLLAMADALLLDSAGREASHEETLKAIGSLVHAATHDTLTGLPTRGVLLERLERELAREAEAGEQIAVMFFDLDNFKLVNDSLGHDSGDEVLREVARRVNGCVAQGDTVSRFGGDELVILHPRARGRSEDEIGQKMLTALADPIRVAGREVVMSASIGVAICTRGEQTAEQLLRDADTALYTAKRRGRNRLERFNDELHAHVARRLRMETDLRAALRAGELYVHYQPQVSLVTGHLVGVEALARWKHPELGPVSPAEFIQVAEDSRLIDELGRQVLRAACRELGEWTRARPERPLTATVNVSPRQLENPSFVIELRQILMETGVNPASLCLELTESAVMHPEINVIDVLEQVRALGVYLAIDDFGIGHSSLSRLSDLPVEVLKIDRAFVDGLPGERGDMAIVSSILSLAYAMGKHVIAEGIERAEQALALREMGCTVAQGYLFSAAVAPTSIASLMDAPLWQPPLAWRLQQAVPASGIRDRRAHSAFIDEFLDHIGVPMDMKRSAAS